MKVHTSSSVFVSTGDTHHTFFYYYYFCACVCARVCVHPMGEMKK